MVPYAAGYSAASADDPPSRGAVFAEVSGGTEGDTLTRMKLSDCGNSPPAELLGALASSLAAASGPSPEEDQAGCVFLFAQRDAAGRVKWAAASHLPEAWSGERHTDQ
jgi:hypothetical protein